MAIGAEGTQTAVANGDTRTLSFYHTHSKERITVTFKKNGRYDQSALKQLNHYLRDWRNQKQTKMDPRLFDVIWEVQHDVGSKAPIHIISSYRSVETNKMLRSRSSGVAKNSQHTLGKAMDIHMPDVSMAKVREAGLRLQRGGVGFYPTSALPFVHLDVGNVRHWPRMTRDQLVRLFPDGRTVHIPSDGKPLKNYALALADIKRGNVATVRGMSATEVAQAQSMPRMDKGFLARFLSGDDEDEDTTTPTTPESAPAKPEPEMAPAIAAIAEAVPMPLARPDAMNAGPQLASAYAPQPALPAGPDMVWQRGADPAAAGRAATSYDLPATTPGATFAMPMPRPDTTPDALMAERATIQPGQPITASLGGGLEQSREAALRMLNQLGAAPAPAAPVEEPAHDIAGLIASAHDAFAPTARSAALGAPAVRAEPAPVARPAAAAPAPAARRAPRAEIASVEPAAKVRGSFSPDRTARDDSLAMNHPNTASAAMLAAPRQVVPSSFGGNPHSGMRSDAFVGASIPVIRTVSFGPRRTADLRNPRG
jgi:uncharacterized protein YcbK (DUF882 family)